MGTTVSVVILAAGKGTRMRRSLPKVLHTIGAKPLLAHVYETAQLLSNDIYIVYGHEGEFLRSTFSGFDCQWVPQLEQKGTGHAVLQAISHLNPSSLDDPQHRILVLYGDVPLITEQTLQELFQNTTQGSLGLITANLKSPTGFGRIIRDPSSNQVLRIVEEKEASAQERSISEINSGIVLFPAQDLSRWLAALKPNNQQGEYFLTDVIGLAVSEGRQINSLKVSDAIEVQGINDLTELATVERHYQLAQAKRLMKEGLLLRDPTRFDLRGSLTLGLDVEIDIDSVLEGKIVLGDRVHIGSHCVLKNVQLGSDVVIRSHSILEDCVIGAGSEIGPFARIRPKTILGECVKIGNFVEIKQSVVDAHSKISHLSYIGDAEIGRFVNIGAGTITCNYDGVNKHKTTIGDRAFIGSNTSLVAPLVIGEGATIGASSVIAKDAPAKQLTLSRSPQETRPDWKRPEDKENI